MTPATIIPDNPTPEQAVDLLHRCFDWCQEHGLLVRQVIVSKPWHDALRDSIKHPLKSGNPSVTIAKWQDVPLALDHRCQNFEVRLGGILNFEPKRGA